ncbi:uncharacterized protein LOC124379185 [Silurus meridionalis]|uniref:uncharacterized protein LOC124379185 n=1 Tax=Silurus meridionalis TaxID=175797 RepID=UPI001EEAE31B|nr:uncharacterized protein LOC124379185 [Silurus meridionalis]
MELQQRSAVSMNVYDNSDEQAKTEDIYQCLQTPHTAPARKSSGQKIKVLLFTIIIVLLTANLSVTGMNYHHSKQTGAEMMNYQKSTKESWYLHDETFYLFWSNQGQCEIAKRFCAERTANLATVTTFNKDWLLLQINGKRMLVKKDQPKRISEDSSGDGFLIHEDFHIDGVDDDDDDNDDAYDCDFFGETPDTKMGEGWVCEKAAQKHT